MYFFLKKYECPRVNMHLYNISMYAYKTASIVMYTLDKKYYL